MQIRPRGDMVLCRLLKRSDRATEGGIVLPAHLEQDFVKLEIVKLGPGRWLENGTRAPSDDLKPGQVVLARGDQKHPRTGMTMLKRLLPVTPDEDLVLVPESEIYAVEVP